MKLNLQQLAKSIYPLSETKKSEDIVVFSHLRWEFVYQRPQHVLSRLAKDRKILFIEEPIAYDDANYGTARIITPIENVSILQPRLPWEELIIHLPRIAQKRMAVMGMEPKVLWFYSASFSDLIDYFDHDMIVYDCMDELSAFKGAPSQLKSQERYLLKRADLVFTGGKSLYEEKSQYHSEVHCFPSSVDRAHFVKSLETKTQIPLDLALVGHPIVGFYGVIDERIDLQLLSAIARKMPEVTFVMIGPVVKIDETDLPQHKNLIYPGSQPYNKLPEYLKAVDIAMMPFALNESTKFISPTKTLEFMAALKPIISTPIRDVMREYSEVVRIVNGVDEFEKAINYYVHEPKTAKISRKMRQQQILQNTAWSKTVESMKALIKNKLQEVESTVSQPVYTPHITLKAAS